MADFRYEIEQRLAGLDVEPARRAEIVEELSQHLADAYDAARARGDDDAPARAAALAGLDSGALADALRGVTTPAPEPSPALADGARSGWPALLFDVRHAVRALRKSPGYTLIALLTLALGLGASVAIFAIVDAVMLRQLPYAQPDALVRVWESNAQRGWTQFSFSQPNFLDFAARTRTFERLAATYNQRLTLTGQGDADVVAARAVSQGFLSVLRVQPTIGRDFTAAEDAPGSDRGVVLLSHAFWQKAFGADPGVLDRTVVLDGVAHRVIGVLPESFEWGDMQLLRPLGADPAQVRGDHRLSVIGRLAPGATLDSARVELEGIAKQLGESYPDTNAGWSVTLQSFYDWLIPVETRDGLVVLAGAVALLLLVACANVANLMLARVNARRRELAIRAALGARRGRIVAYLLSEALLLALGAGLLGLALAALALPLITSAAADALPRAGSIGIGAGSVAFALAVAIGSGLLFGSITAVRASRANLNTALRAASQGSGVESRRTRGALILVEMAVSVALLIGGGLLLRSFWKLQAVDPGFDTASVVVASLTLPQDAYANAPAQLGFYDRLLEHARALPGVRGAALSSIVPLGDGDTSTELRVPGWDRPDDAALPSASWRLVSPGYFATLGIPLRGRDFDARDGADGQPAVIVNEEMARLYFAGQDPIGRTIVLSSFSADPVTIIGVAGDVRTFGLDRGPGSMVYASNAVAPGWSPMQLVVRSALDADAQVGALREAVRDVDPNVPLFGIETIEDRLAATLAPRRLNLWVLACFATAALLLACVGLGGVMAWLVSQRTRELGIRVALGAPMRSVFGLVIGQGMRLALAGAALGVLAALALSRSMESMLFSISARDPLTFAAVPAVLLAVALVACWVPALRAARVDPNNVLRQE